MTTEQPILGLRGNGRREQLTPHSPLHDRQSETRQRIQPPPITL